MRHEYSAVLGDILIRQVEESDIELLRSWRNERENARFLRDIGYITEDMQKEWFHGYLDNDEELFFVIEDIGELKRVVGGLALYDLDREKAECGIGKIQIGDKAAHGKGIGRKALVMAMKIAYQKLDVERIVASVHPDNVQAYHNDMKVGFKIIGEIPSAAGGNEYSLEITEKDAIKANPYYEQIVV